MLETDVRNQARQQVESLAQIQSTISESVRQSLVTMTSLPAFRDNDADLQLEIMAEILRKNPEYVNISRTGVDGIVSLSHRLAAQTDLSERLHIRRALAGAEFAPGEYILARVDGRPSFPYAAAIRNREGKVTGALTAVYELSAYADFYARHELIDDARLLLIDQMGTVLLELPGDSARTGTMYRRDLFAHMTGKAGFFSARAPNGTLNYYTYRAVSMYGEHEPYLYILASIPEAAARYPARRIMIRNMLLLAFIAALSIVFSLSFGYLLLENHLQRMNQAVNEIRQGTLAARTGIVGAPIEIQHAAELIDAMAGELEHRNRERDTIEKGLAKMLEVREVMLREVHHRVKNNLQLMLSTVFLEQQTAVDITDFAHRIENRVRAMSSVHELLYQPDVPSFLSTTELLQNLIAISQEMYVNAHISLQVEPVQIGAAQATSLALIVNELVTNAAKYGGDARGQVQVEITCRLRNEQVELIIFDHGPGFTLDAIDRNQKGFGLQLVKMLVDQLYGTIVFSGDRQNSIVIRFRPEETPD